MKNAVLDTGAKILVPLFIKAGEEILVNTENGSYVSRKIKDRHWYRFPVVVNWESN